jgi:hypothetical protein
MLICVCLYIIASSRITQYDLGRQTPHFWGGSVSPLQLTLCRIVERCEDHVWLLYDLPDGTSLTQKIVASSVLLITEILTIEDHKFYCTFLHVAFRSQSLLKPTSDQTAFDTNWRTGEDD